MTRVENILRVSQAARNSDRELLIIYMQKSGFDLDARQIELLRKMPSFETITRCRRQLQELGRFPASQVVDRRRFEKYRKMRENIKYRTPEEALSPVG